MGSMHRNADQRGNWDISVGYYNVKKSDKLKIVKVMEQTNIEREMDAQEIKRLWQQLAIGTVIALAGLVFMGIGEAICRWIEGL